MMHPLRSATSTASAVAPLDAGSAQATSPARRIGPRASTATAAATAAAVPAVKSANQALRSLRQELGVGTIVGTLQEQLNRSLALKFFTWHAMARRMRINDEYRDRARRAEEVRACVRVRAWTASGASMRGEQQCWLPPSCADTLCALV